MNANALSTDKEMKNVYAANTYRKFHRIAATMFQLSKRKICNEKAYYDDLHVYLLLPQPMKVPMSLYTHRVGGNRKRY